MLVKTLKQISQVFKLRIAAAITLCAIAGMAITPGAALSPWKIAALAIAVFCLQQVPVLLINISSAIWTLKCRVLATGLLSQAGWIWLAGIGLILALAVGAAASVLNAHVALIILAHTIVLVVVSLLPIAFGMGFIYLAGAIAGGSFFIGRSIELIRHPNPKAAMSNFHASFAQLGLLLFAAIVDGSLNL